MEVIPITLREARSFIGEHHRHNAPPHGWKFGVGLENGHGLIGVGVAGQPVARALDDGVTLELTRVCTRGDRNANSQIYGALIRAGRALGYRRFVTYTLLEESGSSLKAVGFVLDGETAGNRSWDMPGRRRVVENLFGETKYPTGPKRRWVLVVSPSPGGEQ